MTTKRYNSDGVVDIESSGNGMNFCRGMSVTMSMGGFQSALFSRSPADCITFLFTDWKLDHPGKFVSAMSKSCRVSHVSHIS
jgi:hypothetical protein